MASNQGDLSVYADKSASPALSLVKPKPSAAERLSRTTRSVTASTKHGRQMPLEAVVPFGFSKSLSSFFILVK